MSPLLSNLILASKKFPIYLALWFKIWNTRLSAYFNSRGFLSKPASRCRYKVCSKASVSEPADTIYLWRKKINGHGKSMASECCMIGSNLLKPSESAKKQTMLQKIWPKNDHQFAGIRIGNNNLLSCRTSYVALTSHAVLCQTKFSAFRSFFASQKEKMKLCSH